MNVDVMNIGHYRVTNYGGRSFTLLNIENNTASTISKDRYDAIMDHKSVEMCDHVALSTRQGV